MNADDEQAGGNVNEVTVVATALDERSDDNCALVVNRGLAAAALGGIPEGLRIMVAAGIPRNICLRVLNSKTRRRASDWR